MKSGGERSDFRVIDVVLACVASLFVLGGFVFLLHSYRPERHRSHREVDEPELLPIKVMPVLDVDAPALALGGKRDRAKLPDRWIKPKAKPRYEERAYVSTKAGKTIADIPPEDVPLSAASAPVPPPNAEPAKQVETNVAIADDAGAPPNVDKEGHEDGVLGGTEKDPLKARAVDIYRDRIRSWFSRRFRVTGSGLGPQEIMKYRVSATIELSTSRLLTGYSITPSGNEAFDRAARAALESAKGEMIPPPPENYPDVIQTTISLTFTCTPERCD